MGTAESIQDCFLQYIVESFFNRSDLWKRVLAFEKRFGCFTSVNFVLKGGTEAS